MISTGFYFKLLAEDKLRSEGLEPNIEEFRFYVNAFSELSTCRTSVMDMGPIPFSAIVDYYKIYELEEEFDDFLYVIRRMDDKLLELERQKGKGKDGRSGKNHKGKR